MALREIGLSSYAICVRSDDTSSMDANETASQYRTHWRPTLTGAQIIARLDLTRCLSAISAKTRLGHRRFEHWCVPIAHRIAEYVQLFPLPGSGRFGQSGGLLIWLLTSCLHALHLRLGDLLPRGTPTEEMFRNEHRWTLALFLAAVLYDFDRILSAMRVEAVTREGGWRVWIPRDGSLFDLGATRYRVITQARSNNAADVAFASTPNIYKRIIPVELSRWLSEDRLLSAELLAVQGICTPDSVLIDLVEYARSQLSVANRLEQTRGSQIKLQPTNSADVHHFDTPRDPELSQQIDASAGTPCEHGSDSSDPVTKRVVAPDSARESQLQLKSSGPPPMTGGEASFAFEQPHPVVRKILDIQSEASITHAPSDLVHAQARFISFDQITFVGIDTAYAIRCLAKANLLLASEPDENSWVHYHQVNGREVRGVLVRSSACNIDPRL